MKDSWVPRSQERIKWFRMWALASEALGLCLASATPRVCGFQSPSDPVPWFSHLQNGTALIPSSKADDKDDWRQVLVTSPGFYLLPPLSSPLWSSPLKSTFSKTCWVTDWFTTVVFFFFFPIPFSLLSLWRLSADFVDLGRTLTPWPLPSLCLFSLYL